MNRNEAIEFLREQSPTAFYGIPFNEPVEFDWSLVDGKFCQDGSTPICESDVFGAESLKGVNYDHVVYGTESLQSRIETLLDMKFETEERLLETIGSLWGKPSTKSAHALQSDIGQLLCCEFNTENELLEHLAVMKVQAHKFNDVKVLLRNNASLKGEDDYNVLGTVQRLLAAPPQPQQKTYWDGAEPLRVDHIVEQGVVTVLTGTKSCIRNHSDELVLVRNSNLKPHPFAKYTDEQREFLQAQVEAGVIKLC